MQPAEPRAHYAYLRKVPDNTVAEILDGGEHLCAGPFEAAELQISRWWLQP